MTLESVHETFLPKKYARFKSVAVRCSSGSRGGGVGGVNPPFRGCFFACQYMKILTDLDPTPPPSKNSGPEPPLKEFLDPPLRWKTSFTPKRSPTLLGGGGGLRNPPLHFAQCSYCNFLVDFSWDSWCLLCLYVGLFLSDLPGSGLYLYEHCAI